MKFIRRLLIRLSGRKTRAADVISLTNMPALNSFTLYRKGN